ncbi:hypothetical protein [Uliginosibacterium sediminicola]|uniref:Uncharacterized protein n=1 Tax=Uliginosibacterium sediminicola TaxID=2024550 RepID=A0ABU9YVZ7_9RHOO
MKTNEQLVRECNELADTFAQMHNHMSRPAFKYYEATHPQEAGFWNMAVAAYDHIEGSDVEAALDEIYDI